MRSPKSQASVRVKSTEGTSLPELPHGDDAATGTSGTMSSAFPEVPFFRQGSPKLADTLELKDGYSWSTRSSSFRHDNFEISGELQVSRVDNFEKMLHVLIVLGWLPQQGGGPRSYIMFFIMLVVDIYLVATTFSAMPQASGDAKALFFMSTVVRHFVIMLGHLGMYFVGGADLCVALRRYDFSMPHANFVAAVFLVVVEFILDILVIITQTYVLIENPFVAVRRVGLLLQKVPYKLSLIVMMVVPKRLCQDLIRSFLAIEEGDLVEGEHLYGVFWKHLRVGKRWYNFVMSPHFVNTTLRIIVALYPFLHRLSGSGLNREEGGGKHFLAKFDMVCLVGICLAEALQMMVWLQPAIAIRRNHFFLLRATAEVAGNRGGSSTALATMIASLHPLAGLKMMGFFVTWGMVTRVTTVGSVGLAGLKYCFDVTRFQFPETANTTAFRM